MGGSVCRGKRRRSAWACGRRRGWRSEKGIGSRRRVDKGGGDRGVGGEETGRGSGVGGIER